MKIALRPAFWAMCWLLATTASGQNFTHFFSDTADMQAANHILREAGGKLWLGGFKLDQNTGTLAAWLYRMDANGLVLKRFRFVGSEYQTWVGMAFLDPATVGVLVGRQNSSGITENWLAVVDSTHIISYQKIEGADNAILDDVNSDGYGHLLACGFKAAPGPPGNDFWLGNISREAQLRWVYNENLTANDHFKMARKGPDNHIYATGDVQTTSYNPYVAKLDTAGNLIWDIILTSPWNDGSQKFDFDSAGRLWLTGESSTAAGTLFDNQLSIVSASGVLEWQQWIGSVGQDAAFVIEKNKSAPGFWVGGYSNAATNGTGPISPYLMQLDGNGNSMGESFWPMAGPSPVYDMEVVGDTTFYFCGVSGSKAYLMCQTKPTLNPVFVVKNQPRQSSRFRILYAPATHSLQVKGENILISDIEVYDVLCRPVCCHPSDTGWIDTRPWPSGLYLLKAGSKNGISETATFVKP